MSYDGVVTKLTSVEPEYQAQVHKQVLEASKYNFNVSVRYDTEYFNGYTVFTLTDSELDAYSSSGGLWTYIKAKEFLNNSSSYAY